MGAVLCVPVVRKSRRVHALSHYSIESEDCAIYISKHQSFRRNNFVYIKNNSEREINDHELLGFSSFTTNINITPNVSTATDSPSNR